MAVGTPVTTSGNSATPSIPATAGVSGDIVIGMMGMDNVATTVTGLGGFTALLSSTVTADGQAVWVGWKRLTGADAGATLGLNSAGGNYASAAIPLTGRHATNPPVAGTVTTQNTLTASPAAVTATGVTALAGDDILHILLPDVNAAGIWNSFSSWTLGTEIVAFEGPTGNQWGVVGVAKAENVGAGATGNKTVSINLASGTVGWATLLVRIPSSGAAAAAATAQPVVVTQAVIQSSVY
jgi:hypothetical protein